MSEGNTHIIRESQRDHNQASRSEEKTCSRETDIDWLYEQAEKRLAATNDAIRTTRTFFFALLSVATYIGIIIAGTTDEQLLRITPARLPMFGVEVPLTGFYMFVPWLFVLLHFNLLIHIGLTSKKLKGFLDDLEPLAESLSARLTRDVANFPLAQWMAVKHDPIFRVLLSILVWITLILIPSFLLLWIQIRFLAFQDEMFTWFHSASVTIDTVLIVGFQLWFIRHVEPGKRLRHHLKFMVNSQGRRFKQWFRIILLQPTVRYLFPMIPFVLSVALSVMLSNILKQGSVENTTERVVAHWISEKCKLDLKEKILTRTTPSAQTIRALRGESNDRKMQAMEKVLGLDLKGRHLIGANFSKAVLPEADLRGAKLQGADFSEAQLQGVQLIGAELAGANFFKAQLQRANLRETGFEETDFRYAQLQGSDLNGAQMQNVKLIKADLKEANLQGADLQKADLLDAQLVSANLMQVKLNHAMLRNVNLQKAQLRWANLENAILIMAQLQNADLRDSQLHGARFGDANLEDADLSGADCTDADFRGANLKGVKLEGIKGTFYIPK